MYVLLLWENRVNHYPFNVTLKEDVRKKTKETKTKNTVVRN